METCLLGLTQLGNKMNQDLIDTLGKIVALFPIHLQSKWAKRASQLTPTVAAVENGAQAACPMAEADVTGNDVNSVSTTSSVASTLVLVVLVSRWFLCESAHHMAVVP